jgi:hypothetical protein
MTNREVSHRLRLHPGLPGLRAAPSVSAMASPSNAAYRDPPAPPSPTPGRSKAPHLAVSDATRFVDDPLAFLLQVFQDTGNPSTLNPQPPQRTA